MTVEELNNLPVSEKQKKRIGVSLYDSRTPAQQDMALHMIQAFLKQYGQEQKELTEEDAPIVYANLFCAMLVCDPEVLLNHLTNPAWNYGLTCSFSTEDWPLICATLNRLAKGNSAKEAAKGRIYFYPERKA